MRTPRSGRFCAVLFALITASLSARGAWAAEKVSLRVRETAGIRRFGYPVSAKLELDSSVGRDAQFRLLLADKPIIAQFRRVDSRVVTIDFDSNFMPLETRDYVVEFGGDVPAGPEPERGLKVEETNDSYVISNGTSLIWTVRKDLAGLVRSVKNSSTEFLQPESAGLVVVRADGSRHQFGAGGTISHRVVKQGPIDCAIRFETDAMPLTGHDGRAAVELEFPRSKSWVKVDWSIEDGSSAVSRLESELNLRLGSGPTLVDFGVDGLVYAAVPAGQVAAFQSEPEGSAGNVRNSESRWMTLRGAPGKLEPYVVALPGRGTRVEGWAHVMDRERCTAVAIHEFAQSARDRIESSSEGRLTVAREFVSPRPDRSRSLQFWVHVVPFPPHIGAVTSPQSMQRPLEVSWAAQSAGSSDLTVEQLHRQAKAALAQTNGEIRLDGLSEPVEVLRDRWGVPHIYAKNSNDLFFAQGFVQAQDRLWQMEIWRRTTQGKLAEIVGADAVDRDRFARLMEYRGDMDAEWAGYGPEARAAVESFVRGVNAFVATCRENPPIEFQLTGIRPEPWTPDVCLGRMAGFIMCRNAANEVFRAQLIRELGAAQAARLLPIDPFHEITLPAGLELDGLDQRITAGINALSSPIHIPLAGGKRASSETTRSNGGQSCDDGSFGDDSARDHGSNNWVISGRLTVTGKPILASDPHRPVTLPSLRYIVHLNSLAREPAQPSPRREAAPAARGWNVIGGTEPALPGVAIGHNDRIAWGMTIVGTDQTDIYVEETDPNDPNRYLVGTEWQSMRVEQQTIVVRGEPEPRRAELKFTRHGPVIFEDIERHRAYALRWAGSEPGTAGYMGALALDRAANWKEFLNAAERWRVPSENLVYADVDGYIGWIAAALTPVRPGWDGLLPVPGAAGKYEWAGFLPTAKLPQLLDPATGYIATANHNILPAGYDPIFAFEWSPPFRFGRIDEVMRRQIDLGRKFSLQDSQQLQHDATSLVTRRLLGMLNASRLEDPVVPTNGTEGRAWTAAVPLRDCMALLGRWDGVLTRESGAAALFEVWQNKLAERVLRQGVPEKLWERYAGRASLVAALDLLETGSQESPSTESSRRTLIFESLRDAVDELSKQQGTDPLAWQWGKMHRAHFKHMLGMNPNPARPPATNAVPRGAGVESNSAAQLRSLISSVFDLPSVSRSGDANAPIATGGANFQQVTGASYRQVVDLADWDRSVATSVPGQSGQPGSPHYGDLLPLWERGEYFPLPFSRGAVEAATTDRLVLSPKRSN